ncbi:MAG TPA: urea ABC transporter permease subunit UrtB, partial [Burkholderiales bacterium]|nr:urea ABC transporter permease subunit UrtB [Burkholderiales bacterium]
MTDYLRRCTWAALLICGGIAAASAAPLTPQQRLTLMQNFCAGGAAQRTAIDRIVSVGVADDRDWSSQVMAALRNGGFVCRQSANPVIIGSGTALDASTLQPVSEAPAELPYVPSIVMMRALAVASAELDLFSPKTETRRAAAAQIDRKFAALNPALVERALANEHDAGIKRTLSVALAKRGLNSELPAERLKAIAAVAQVPSETSRTLLTNFLADHKDTLDPASVRATQAALRTIDEWLLIGKVCSV